MSIIKKLLLSLLFCSCFVSGQTFFSYKGFVQNLQTNWIQELNGDWFTMNSINNRFDFEFFPIAGFSANLGLRNNFSYGQMIQLFPDYKNSLAQDAGFINLSNSFSSGKSYILYSNIDRLFIDYSFDKFELKLGRQRINWGINLVWNPNDVFNTYSYFDFDYEEKPGSDAARFVYYTGAVSQFEIAAKLNLAKKLTAAVLYKFNNWNYDFQFLSGFSPDDILAGFGWSGELSTAGFNGEITYFQSKKESKQKTVVASSGINYTFSNGLYLHGSILFNSEGTTGNAGRGTVFIEQNVSAKTLSLAKYSAFSEISYPFTPLFRGGISSIFNPNDKSFFCGVSSDYSISDNIGLLFMAQLFSGKQNSEFGNLGKLFFLRLRLNY